MPFRLSDAYHSYTGSALFSLNYIHYNMYKKNCAWSPHQLCKKRVIIVLNVHIVIIVQKRHCSFGKSSIYACNYVKSLALSVLNMVLVMSAVLCQTANLQSVRSWQGTVDRP